MNALIAASPQTFADFYARHEANLTYREGLAWVGIEVDGHLADEPPKLAKADLWREQGAEVNSLSVAVARMEVFIDAAKELAALINNYQLQQIEIRLATAEPAEAKQLQALRTRLAKKTSHFFPVTN
ncbi:hypothetical protein C9418_06985 [Rhizobium sp. SEMIA 4032]|nr:hypothetical protein C9418_06985 [Rhizobium sp. SEMIA 4032]